MKMILLVLVALQGAHIGAMTTIIHPKHRLSGMSLEQVVRVKPPANIKTVSHKKEANGGYKKGSPLYNQQEGLEGHKKTAKADTQAITDTQGASITPAGAAAHVYEEQLYEYIISVSVYAIMVFACAYFYSKRETFKSVPLGSRTNGAKPTKMPAWTTCGFSHSLIDLGNIKSDWPMCLTAFCCPIIQWADTASRSAKPFMGYWKAVAFLLSMVILSPFTLGLTGLVILIVVKMRRSDLHETYGHTSSQTRSMFEDLCLVFCCRPLMCCQLVQEAREVEYTSPKVITV